VNLPVNGENAPPARVAVVSGANRPIKERNSLLRYGAALAVVAVLFAGGVYLFLGHDDMPPPRQVRELTIVNIAPPPPPPPPPPPEQKMIEQPKMAEQDFKEEKPIEKSEDEPIKDISKTDLPPDPGTLSAPIGPGGVLPQGSGGGGGGRSGGGSRWGWYASIVQTQIRAALEANPKTRHAVVQLQIRLWADGFGRVNRVQLMSSTGDAELDAAIRNDVLGGLTLREPPPKDMPMPIITRVTERRSS